jgi:RNA polymerase sporulation-specific sigma factor
MDTLALIQQAREGDKAARDKVITENIALVWSIVRRFTNRGCDAQDLFQIGSIGLMKAVDKFDESFQVQFSTYAVPMISGEIKRFLRDDGMLKVSRSLKENGWRVQKAKEKLAQELGRDGTINEVAKETGLSIEDIVMAMEANSEVESIYKPVYQSDENEICLVDKLPEPVNKGEQLLNRLVLRELLKKLEEKERKLICLRYFEERTQAEVARELGISQVQVSRLEKKILGRMQKEFQR